MKDICCLCLTSTWYHDVNMWVVGDFYVNFPFTCSMALDICISI